MEERPDEEQPDSAEAPPIGTVVHGGYELLRFLGAGAMGAVYEAQTLEKQRVAIKILLRSALRLDATQILERFKREVRVAAALDHPHVVPVLDAGVDRTLKLPFMVMPLMIGLDVGQLLARVGPLHPVAGVRIVRQLCSALAAAHEAGVVHRDVKPANLFLAHAPGGEVTARVLDFGIAKWKADDAQLTHTTCLLGTPYYSAPEQLKSSKGVDERADLWSAGMTLYQLLSGTVPNADAAGLVQVITTTISTDPPHIQDAAPWIEPGLAAVVHGVLQRDRDRRCPSAKALAEVLAPFAGGSDDLTAGMLAPLGEEIRALRLVRATLPAHWDEVAVPVPSTSPLPASEELPDPHLGRRFGGRFEVLRRISEGAMGAVYEAQGDDGNRYAVKVIGAEAAAKKDAVRRFVREARAITAIDDEHVVRLIEAGAEQDKTPFLVMDLLQGFDLGRVLRHCGALAPDVATRLFAQACRGIHAAHVKGIVHRDIKPANLFLHELPDGQVVVKVCDFGVAKQLAGQDGAAATAVLTRTGGFLGSPMYMSPEQARNARDIDARTDTWSVGASLFQALTGTRPWQGQEGVGEVIVAICTEPVPQVQDRAPWVPVELAELVERAMRRDPAERFATVRELGEALERLADGKLGVRVEEVIAATDEQRLHHAPRASSASATGATAVSGDAATVASHPSGGATLQSGDGASSHTAGALSACYTAPPVRSRWPRGATLGGLAAAAVLATVLLIDPGGVPAPAVPTAADDGAAGAAGAGVEPDPEALAPSSEPEVEASATASASSLATEPPATVEPRPRTTTTAPSLPRPTAPAPPSAAPTSPPTPTATPKASATATTPPDKTPAATDTWKL